MKRKNIYKVLAIAILVTIVLSFFIPGRSSNNYGTFNEGTITPVAITDLFTNGLTSLSAFLTTFSYILAVGIFYAVLKKTNKYDVLVNNTAASFKKNKRLFIVLSISILGLFSLFTNDMYVMLVFVPFLISVIRKLGYSKETSLISTIGAILIGQTGAIYTFYINQILSLTFKDNLLPKVVVCLLGLLFLAAFVLVFDKKAEPTSNLEKTKEKKVLPIYIILCTLFVILILGFVNWNNVANFKGFDSFLETLRDIKIGKVSVFDSIVGKSALAFGAWQLYNVSTLLLFITLILMIIYRVKINDMFDSFADGLKKSFPYALIVVLANVVLVNVFSSGIFNTITLALTKSTISTFNGTLTSIISALSFPDYNYATQFALQIVRQTSANGYENLFAVLFQTVYSLFLLISPTSILLLMGLKYNDIRYRDWLKYIWKFFLVLLLSSLVVISIFFNGFDAFGIIALILLVIAVALIVYLKRTKITKKEEIEEKNVKKEVEETKKIVKDKKKVSKKVKSNSK